MTGVTALEFGDLDASDRRTVTAAIERGENFYGYIPSSGLAFITRNYRVLAELGALEPAWIDAYVHASHFDGVGVEMLSVIFDACDRNRLLALKPLGDSVSLACNGRVTLFRGCAGPNHRMGMSWTPSLDRAIWYAAHHAAHHGLGNVATYAATVDVSEIYCRLDHYDDDLIVCPAQAWQIDIPASEFRLDRPR